MILNKQKDLTANLFEIKLIKNEIIIGQIYCHLKNLQKPMNID